MRKYYLPLITLTFISLSISAQITPSSQWTWVKGDSVGHAFVSGQFGVYGILGVPNAANKPGGRADCVSWMDGSGNLWLFGGYYYDWSNNPYQFNDLWKYSPSTNQWTWVKGDSTYNQYGVYGTKGVAADANKPGGRGRSVSWTDAAGNFWLFGGEGRAASTTNQLNDLWKYNPSTNEWTWMSGDSTSYNNGVYGIKSVPAVTNTPGGREGSASWKDGSNNLWLFGGYGPGASGSFASPLNDLWKYDLITNQWTWINGDSVAFPLRYGVYGTQGVAAAANKPGGRELAVSWSDASGNLWLFGGNGHAASSDGRLNDLWKYSPLTNQWTWVKGYNTSNGFGTYGTQGAPDIYNSPGSRYGSIRWTDGTGNFWLFGGFGFDGLGGDDFDDLWKFDVSSSQWTWMKGDIRGDQYGIYGTLGVPSAANNPGGRVGSVSWIDGSDNLWLFGGAGWDVAGNEALLNDLWKLSYALIPVSLTSIKASQQNTGINVEWTFTQEMDMDRYEIEKSITGANLSRGGTVISSGNHSSTITYNWFDANPNHGANFYRIKMIGKDGKETYSQIVKVVIGKGSSISIYPNPVTNNSFALQFNDQPKGSYDIRIINSAGQLIYKSVINHNGGSATQTIQLPMLLAKGMYSLEVVGVDGNGYREKLIIQ
jgi:N-acetylneuraminic acid mutarotase